MVIQACLSFFSCIFDNTLKENQLKEDKLFGLTAYGTAPIAGKLRQWELKAPGHTFIYDKEAMRDKCMSSAIFPHFI